VNYTLATIKDIFELIPADRVDDCMYELTQLIKQAQAVNGLIQTIANDLGTNTKVVFPDSLVWKDDKKGTLDLHININEKPVATIKSKIKGNK